MSQNDGVDLLWSTLFKFNNQNKGEIVKEIKARTSEDYNPNSLAVLLSIDYNLTGDANYVKACEISALRFCLEGSDIASEFLTEEDFGKASAQFARKQYSGKLPRELLAKFVYLANAGGRPPELKLLLRQDISRTYKALREEETIKSFRELKEEMDKKISGVKSECYIAAEKAVYREKTIRDELNGFLIKKYGYNLNRFTSWHFSELEKYHVIYQRALFDNAEFWKKHERFNVFAFAESVFELNDEKRAQKILSVVFDNIKNDGLGAKLIENNLSFIFFFKQQFYESLKKNTLYLTFWRFKGDYDLAKIEDEIFCYPLVTADNTEEKISAGKEIIGDLFKAIYPADSERVIKFFGEQLAEDKNPYTVGNGVTVKDLFNYFTFGYFSKGDNKKAVEVLCPDFFSPANMWNRIYLIAYSASVLESDKDKRRVALFEILYDWFKTAESKFGLKTSFQKDTAGRGKAYSKLKEILKNYSVEISDRFKNDYIISLLDRKVAVREESERFPVLEQLGDAVYGLAVAEMMFYRPAVIEDESIFKDYEKHICAEAQVGVARMLGIDAIYISSLSLSYKFTRDGINIDHEAVKNKFKYLADSLEMIIGTVCLDCGYKTALDFTKRIIKEHSPDLFKKEIRWENRDEADPDTEIDWEYWNRIKPSPFHRYDTYSSKQYTNELWHALNKFMLAHVLGTDGVEERKFITSHNKFDAEYGDTLFGENRLKGFYINYALYDYLHNGLAYTVEKYSGVIKENYKKING